jgi:hypothetical protein
VKPPKDAEPAKEDLLRVRQQVMAPGDCLAHVPEARWKIARATREQFQPIVVESSQQGTRWQHRDPGRCQLDR